MSKRIEKYKANLAEAAESLVDEPVEAVGVFQPKGSAGAMGVAMVSGLGGMIAKKTAKNASGGLPQTSIVVATATTIHVFDGGKPKSIKVKVKGEVAAWPRNEVQASRGKGKMTDQLTLTIPDGTSITLESWGMGSGGINDEILDALVG